ncbi:MAG: carbamoyltransferase HypF [Anaerolineales bacterium]|nr:carbamoyltransferase HypF [Anaerolineales bacterium]
MSASNDAPSTDPTRRLRLEIHGAVQGVGFRPFVYRLATELALAGWVINNSQGVFIEVEGSEQRVQRFLERLPLETPPRAIVHSLDKEWLEPVSYDRFEIRHSEEAGQKTALVLPDIATCPDCLAEVLDSTDRRHGYPFTNCTNCGPRFSIIQALPYDRPNTTMRQFVMCPVCQAEYDDPRDRRFHAQPSACPVCGPRVVGWGVGRGAWGLGVGENDPIRTAADALLAGQIVAVKGLGGFHLMVDAGNTDAIERLRGRKPRRDKPFALMVRDLDAAQRLCVASAEAEALLTSAEAPIVLLPRRDDAPVADAVAPGNPTLGVMLPYTPLHHLLLQEVARSDTGHNGGEIGHSIEALVATSGNLSDEPICTDEHEAVERLGHIADLFLVHDRPIERHVDDSVAWIVEGKARLLRRARGFAPLPVLLHQPAPVILAVGAHLKNTVALSVGRQVFISQHIGDLETPESLAAFERVIADFLRLYEAEPVVIAHDMHPEYLSTNWAEEREGREKRERRERAESQLVQMQKHPDGETASPVFPSFPSFPLFPSLLPVQHHHAHLAACLAEHGVDGPALGVTWDGTGYGLDGTIWGGEFLLGDAREFQRVAHLRPFRLPGGDAAVKEPRRVAFAMLWELYGDEVLDWDFVAPVRALRRDERTLLSQMLARGLNAPITTSAGRLFDGVAALIGLHQQVTFEGQAAMALEFAADARENSAYNIHLAASASQPSTLTLDWQPMVEEILSDLRRGVSSGMMAARFHNALVRAIVATAQEIGEERVALTGGCFQNRLLVERTARRLRTAGFEVLLHRQVPPNDGGISLGQIAVAAAQFSEQ